MNSRFAWAVALPAVAALYWITLFIATHIPRQFQMLENGRDKYIHFAAFAVLGFLVTLCVSRWWNLSFFKCLGILAAIAVYGAIDEYLQAVLTPPRQADVMDWVMDVCGGFAGILVAAGSVKWLTKSSAEPERNVQRSHAP